MKTACVAITLSLLMASAIPCPGLEAPATRSISVMRPGDGLGDIVLGDSIPGVIKKMNDRKPDEGQTVKFGATAEYWLSYTDLGITFIFDEKKELIRIAVKNPGIIVQQSGLRVNGTVMDLDREYGKGEQTRLDDLYDQKVYRDRGIAFTINRKTERIETITIQSRGR
jgi:hypothetical protein